MTQHNNQPITHQPDIYIDLESNNMTCSSAGKFDIERLNFFQATIFPYWFEHRCSLHQLAEYLAQFDIELWTAHDLNAFSANKEFAFEIRFLKQYPGAILVQAERLLTMQVH